MLRAHRRSPVLFVLDRPKGTVVGVSAIIQNTTGHPLSPFREGQAGCVYAKITRYIPRSSHEVPESRVRDQHNKGVSAEIVSVRSQ